MRRSLSIGKKGKRDAERRRATIAAQLTSDPDTQRQLGQAEEAERERRIAARRAQVETLNQKLVARVATLRSLLLGDPDALAPLDIESMKKPLPPPFDAEAAAGPRAPRPIPEDFSRELDPPGFWGRRFGGQRRYLKEKEKIEESNAAAFQSALWKYDQAVAKRAERLGAALAEYKRHYADIERYNSRVAAFQSGYERGDEGAVVEYFSRVLERSSYPEGFPKEFRLAFVRRDGELIVECRLPTVEIVPPVASYAYVARRDEIRRRARSEADVTELYRAVIAALVLRLLNEVFSADVAEVVDACVINGVVSTIDPGTGRSVRPCLVSVRAAREEFTKLVLDRIEPVACLQGLGAAMAEKPQGLTPVRPVVTIDAAKLRGSSGGDPSDWLLLTQRGATAGGKRAGDRARSDRQSAADASARTSGAVGTEDDAGVDRDAGDEGGGRPARTTLATGVAAAANGPGGGGEADAEAIDLDDYPLEPIVTTLLNGMGLEARISRSSPGGDVDCLAFDPRPIVGGKVVIRARKRIDPVGVASVRSLHETIVKAGAYKGVLITTSSYDDEAHAFAEDKPIELIDGRRLRLLLAREETDD